MNKLLQISFAVVISLTVTSCSLLSPLKMPKQSRYVLNAGYTPKISRVKTNKAILVMQPDVDPLYSSTQIAYSNQPNQIAYFANNQWAEAPSIMLQTALVNALHDTHHYKAVLAPPAIGAYHYILSSQVTKLVQNFNVKPAILTFAFRVQLVQVATNKIVFADQYTFKQPLRFEGPYAGVLATNVVANKMLRKVIPACVRYAK